MSDGDRPSKVQLLTDALQEAQRREPPEGKRPRRASVIPPASDRRSMPHRETRRANAEQRRASLMPEHERAPQQASLRPKGYTNEVKRPNLIDGDDANPYATPPPTGSRFPGYTPEVKRPSLLPPDRPAPKSHAPGDTLEPEWRAPPRDLSLSMPPAPSMRPNYAPPPAHVSLPPAEVRQSLPGAFQRESTSERRRGAFGALRSLLPGQKEPSSWEQDPRFVDAMTSRSRGRKIEALLQLEQLLMSTPEHADARREIFNIAAELKLEPRIQQHVDWVLLEQAHGQEHGQLCTTYRGVRMTFPNVGYCERTLIAAMIAGEKTQDGRVIVDVTKLLLRDFPQSEMLPRAFMSSAQVQINEGRPDLARNTLQNLIARFPFDPLTAHARRKLAELG